MRAERARPAWSATPTVDEESPWAAREQLTERVHVDRRPWLPRKVRRTLLARGRWAAPVAVLFALAARLPYFFRTDFPLNDGGLFVVMSRDLLANHFALPAVTSYNGEGIPFAYPPLAFYVVAALQALTGADAIEIARWLPLMANLASVVAVATLARAVLRPAWAAALAPIVFALLPRSYEWMIMGGGLTRSLGYLLAIVAAIQAIYLARSPSVWRTALCAVLSALALATHLEEGLFAMYSVALALFCYGGKVRAVLTCGVICAGAALLTAPWWGTVVAQHGIGPFQAASMTSGWTSPGTLVAGLGEFLAPPSLPLSIIGSLGVLGAAACLSRGDLFLPLWLAAIFVLTPRSAPSEGVLPLALLASLALGDIVLPVLVGTMRQNRAARTIARQLSTSRRQWIHKPSVRVLASSIGLVLLLGGVTRVWPRLPLTGHTLDSLSTAERAAMAWVASNTDPDARFLVLSTTASWEEDQAGEWFPVLAQRQSVATPQGAEWLPDHTHARKVCLFKKVRELSGWDRGISELDTWATDRGVLFSDVYVSKADRGPIDWSAFLASAASSPNYTLVLDTPEAAVLHRNAPITARWPESGESMVSDDCQSLADQDLATITNFQGRYGGQAGLFWVREHELALPARSSVAAELAQVATTLRGQ